MNIIHSQRFRIFWYAHFLIAISLGAMWLSGCSQPTAPTNSGDGQSNAPAPTREIAKTPTWSQASNNLSESQEIKYSNRSLSALELVELRKALELRVLVQVFQAHAHRQDLHPQLQSFIQEAIDSIYSFGTQTRWQELHAKGKAVQEQLADDPDPIVEYYIARSLHSQTKMGEAALAAQRAIRLFRKYSYPSYFVVMSHRIFSESFLSSPDIGIQAGDASRNPMISDYKQAVQHWLQKDLGETGDEHRIVYHIFTKVVKDFPDENDESLAELQEFVTNECQLPPWLQEMIIGQLYSARAWASRGHGYAYSVTENGWKVFQEFGAHSGEHFRKALAINPHFPESAYEMISVSMTGQDKDSPRDWFNRCQKIQFDFGPAYSSLANALHPKWGGDFNAILALANECL